jgi:hypothetical protein
MRFPFRLSDNGWILIDVKVSDDMVGEFLLDTGAGIHVLSKKLLNRGVNPKPAGHFTGFRHTGERVELELFQIASLNIGDFRQEDPIVTTWDTLDNMGLDGLLSAKFFEHHIVTLDFIKQELIFEDERTLPNVLQQGNSVDLKISDDRGKILQLFVDLLIGESVVAECELDTGSDGLLILDMRYLPLLKINGNSANVSQDETKSITGLIEERLITDVSNISLRGSPKVVVDKSKVVFKSNLIFDGDLGIKFWANRRLTIDIPHQRIIVGQE